MINRRGFLKGLVGAVAAPAVVKAENLMKIWVPPIKPWIRPSERIASMRAAMLKTAIPVEVLTHGSAMIKMPEGDVIPFRRWIPYVDESPLVVPADTVDEFPVLSQDRAAPSLHEPLRPLIDGMVPMRGFGQRE
jgi:hypothetical protein